MWSNQRAQSTPRDLYQIEKRLTLRLGQPLIRDAQIRLASLRILRHQSMLLSKRAAKRTSLQRWCYLKSRLPSAMCKSLLRRKTLQSMHLLRSLKAQTLETNPGLRFPISPSNEPTEIRVEGSVSHHNLQTIQSLTIH